MANRVQYMVCNECSIPCEFYYGTNGTLTPIEDLGCIAIKRDRDKAKWKIVEVFDEVEREN